MHLRSFVAGSLTAVAFASIAAFAAGMSWFVVLGMALSVWIAAQILYVGLIALLARDVGRASEPVSPTPKPSLGKPGPDSDQA